MKSRLAFSPRGWGRSEAQPPAAADAGGSRWSTSATHFRNFIAKLLPAFLFAIALSASAFAQKKPALQPPDPLNGPPVVSAKAWVIADGDTGKILWSDNASVSRNMASTTKIMTAWIVLGLAEKNPDVLEETLTVTKRADGTGGSTSGIREGEKLPVADVLYGLLLPSGNDAAVALAEYFGNRFPEVKPDGKDGTDPLRRFVAEMNRRAKKLGMKETQYLDPHGNSRNRSSARDLLTLTMQALKNEQFKQYVKTREYQCEIKTPNGKSRKVTWKNTNKLLSIEGFDGVKTGFTGGAGGCLVSSGRRNGDHLLVVVLGSASHAGRFVDSRNLFVWAWRQRLSQPGGDKPNR